MGQEAERDDIEAWLMRSPVDWCQALSTRVALRVLPLVLEESIPQDWFDTFAMAFLRASVTNWILRQPLNAEGTVQLQPPGARAAADAAFIVRAAARAADDLDQPMSLASDIIANATDAARADEYPEFAARASYDAVRGAWQLPHLRRSVENDRERLTQHSSDTAGVEPWSERLIKSPLWLAEPGFAKGHKVFPRNPAGQLSIPSKYGEAWEDAKHRLESAHETYRVWIDWYENVLRGNARAFASTQPVEDFVRGRIIEAGQSFWKQDPVFVNETILSWILQLELEAELEVLADKIRASRTTRLDSVPETEARAALRNLLRPLADLEPPAPGAIGHNQPPEPLEWQVDIIIFADIRKLAGDAEEELAKAAPNPALVAQNISVIGTAMKKLLSLTGRAADKAADAFGTAMGAAAGVALISVITLLWTGLLGAATEWLRNLL